MSSESLICNACQFTVTNPADRQSHYRSEWHRYNVKRRCAGLLPINSSLFNTQFNNLQLASNKSSEPVVKVKQKCLVCSKTFASQSSFDAHLLAKKHIKLEQHQSASGIINTENSEDDEEENDSEEVKDGENQKIGDKLESKFDDMKIDENDINNNNNNSNDEIREYDGYELQSGEEPIPLLNCLFCNSKFSVVTESIDHMHKSHGLFIPFSNHIISFDALLIYLGEKVGIGHVCVYCNQRFSSTLAVQAHMKEKSHCKMRLDNDEDEEEYSDYFEFPESINNEENGENNSNNRRLTGVTDNGELLLSDGSTIGHRQYNHIYTQRIHTPATQPESVAIASAAYQFSQYGDSTALTVNGNNNKQLSTMSLRQSRINRDKESGVRYRESWIRKNERRLLLKVGMRNNDQKHYRAQVQF